MVKGLRPSQPVHCMHREAVVEPANLFLQHFHGHSLYAVKANPDPIILQWLYNAGIRHFDVASLGEVKLVRGMFPNAHLAFMNPIKSREAIRAAYFEYGVRDFVIDTFEELHKVLEETKVAADLTIVVRLAMPKGTAAYSLAGGKFGCTPEVAVSLLRDADKVAHRVGLSFHVGSQTLDPMSYANGIQQAGELIREAGVALDVFDIGGGFPIPDLGMDIPPLTTFFDVIHKEIAKLKLPKACEIWSEPGRVLSGSGETLVVRVELRKGDALYINDGTFGSMFEVASGSWKNSVQLIRPRKGRKGSSKPLAPFRFYGPTCDSIDYMEGPFMLPEDVCEGDWIAIKGMGAYMTASQSRFNGFYSDVQVEIDPTRAPTVLAKRRNSRASHLKLVSVNPAREQ